MVREKKIGNGVYIGKVNHFRTACGRMRPGNLYPAVFYALILSLSWLVFGCEATRYVPKNERLIRTEAEFKGNSGLSTDKLRSGIKSKPNRRIVIPKIYLHFYNLGQSIENDSSFVRKWVEKADKRGFFYKEIPQWLKTKLGEKANTVSTEQLIEDCKNLENIYFANGFFNARVQYQILPSRFNYKKAEIIFHIREGRPHFLEKIRYETRDTVLLLLVSKDIGKSLLRINERYSEDNLSEERVRLTEYLRENGYFRFAPSQISYRADTLPDVIEAFDTRTGKKPKGKPMHLTMILPDSSRTYRIAKVEIRIRSYADDSFTVRVNPDSLTAEDLRAIGLTPRKYDPNLKFNLLTTDNAVRLLNFKTLHGAINFRQNALFSPENHRISQRRLQELGIFNNSIIRFYANDSNRTLIAETDLVLQKRFGYRVGFEAFQADQFNLGSNYPGVGSNVELSIRNAFKRAELITATGNGSVYFINERGNELSDSLERIRFFLQWGARLSLRVPRFWFIQPLADKISKKKWATFVNPGTSVSMLYRRDNPLVYVRSTFQTEYSYQWFHEERGNRRKISQFSTFTPFNITLVRSEYESSALIRAITGKSDLNRSNETELRLIEFLFQDLTRRFVSYSSYYRTISYQYGLDRRRNTWFLRFGTEMGGNIPYLIDAIGTGLQSGDNTVEDVQVQMGTTRYSYGQFLKFSGEGKYFIPFGKKAELVMRGFLGISQRIGHTRQLLFENRFYAGGTNSVRGWQSNTLGPGSIPPTANAGVFVGGEYKMEANLEYRQDLVSPTEIAFFLDAGNVWFSANSTFQDPKAKLAWNNLAPGLAGGIGLRFDLGFVVLRFDVGQQLYAPDLQGWVVKSLRNIGFPRIQYNLAIGYPF